MSETILINEVGPRDGLQNQAKSLTVAERIQLIEALVNAKLPAIEVGSFVSPKAVPAMAQTDQVIAGLADKASCFSVLVANRQGYDLAVQAGIKVVNLPIAASNTMNEKNIRKTNRQAAALCEDIIEQGSGDGIKAIPYIATAWHCPYEGEVNAAVVMDMTERFFSAGASKVILADTIGAANPAQVAALLQTLVKAFGADNLGVHFHDTRGFGVANAFAAAQAGIRWFDGSIGGLGGCPFAPGATGNVATEDLVVLFEQMGFDTGIDLSRLLSACELAKTLTSNCIGGRSLPWLQRQQEKDLL